MRGRRILAAAAVASPLLAGGCATLGPAVVIGPSVTVQPGPGRSAASLAMDRRACTAETDRQVQPAADRISAGARAGLPQPASVSAQVQILYDQAYGPCMASRGNIVGTGGPTRQLARLPQGRPGPSPTNTGLSDPDSTAALSVLAGTIAGFRRDCEGERIEVSTTEAVLSPSSNARSIVLSTPGGGSCFGQPGQNAYLVAKVGGTWRTLLKAEPGSIQISDATHNGYGDAEVHSLGMCVYTYRWDGSCYVQSSASGCVTAAPPTMSTLPRAIQRN